MAQRISETRTGSSNANTVFEIFPRMPSQSFYYYIINEQTVLNISHYLFLKNSLTILTQI